MKNFKCFFSGIPGYLWILTTMNVEFLLPENKIIYLALFLKTRLNLNFVVVQIKILRHRIFNLKKRAFFICQYPKHSRI